MKHLIACRIRSYGRHQDRGWSHLPQLGIYHVEADLPGNDAQAQRLRQRLSENGLSVNSFEGSIRIDQPNAADLFQSQAETCNAFDTRFMFVSVKAGELDRQLAYDRMRQVGDVAAAHGITVVMETHPDLITNGRIAKQSMKAINHPQVRVNFDTANVHFYNENTRTEDELAQCIDYVAAVHLKDSTGIPRAFDFPVLGQGIVDFPMVMQMLDDHGFTGPCTLELEGTAGVEFSEPEQLQHIEKSVAYLRGIGLMD